MFLPMKKFFLSSLMKTITAKSDGFVHAGTTDYDNIIAYLLSVCCKINNNNNCNEN